MDSTYEIVKELIDFNSEGVDTYNHNGSTWLIFTDQKKWVIELTKEKTLWYNYYFFTGVFKYLSLDVVENQHYITKWVEDTIINPVKHTSHFHWNNDSSVEDTIENGVKDIQEGIGIQDLTVEDTFEYYGRKWNKVNDTIQNGVRNTEGINWYSNESVEDTIKNGVKGTISTKHPFGGRVEDTIQNGVKKTKRSYEGSRKQRTKDTIENGIKETHRFGLGNEDEIEDTIQNGVKHTQGSIFDNPTTVKDTIENGVKETSFWSGVQPLVEDVTQNGVKKTYSDKIPHEYDWTNQFTEEIDIIIENGVKETKLGAPDNRDYFIEDAIQNGVKETTPGGYLGFVEKKGKKIHQFETAKQLYYVEDVIESGIKKTEGGVLFDESKIDRVISEGVKETHDDVMPHTGRVKGVIKNGVKQCIPSHIPLFNPMDFSIEYCENHRTDDVASVLEKGIKEVQPLPSQEGNMDWGIYYHRQEVPTKPHTQYVDDVITNGIKETKPMDEWVNTERILDGVIDKGIKETKSSGSDFPKWADEAIVNGTKNPTF